MKEHHVGDEVSDDPAGKEHQIGLGGERGGKETPFGEVSQQDNCRQGYPHAYMCDGIRAHLVAQVAVDKGVLCQTDCSEQTKQLADYEVSIHKHRHYHNGENNYR